jgi:hypothetical protein
MGQLGSSSLWSEIGVMRSAPLLASWSSLAVAAATGAAATGVGGAGTSQASGVEAIVDRESVCRGFVCVSAKIRGWIGSVARFCNLNVSVEDRVQLKIAKVGLILDRATIAAEIATQRGSARGER